MTGKIAILMLGVIAMAGAMSAPSPVPQRAPVIEAEAKRIVPRSREELMLSFSPVVKQTAPAVVNIYTKKVVERQVSPFANDPFFEDFFRDMFPRGGRKRRRIENSLGSGVILDPSGIVVSNYHVVGDADEITVVLQDRREFQGAVILADEESDLAVVKLEGASGLPALELRDSDALEVGDIVLAIGNPFGVGQTVTSGIISGLARSGSGRGRGKGFFIQTDAAINPGNSGGALVDMQGRLVGVNTAILSRSGGSNGIGFAIPANLVARVVNSARLGKTMLERPWLGLDATEVDGDLAQALGLAVPRGIAIEELHPTSPLVGAGLDRGDIITSLDGDPVNTVRELNFRAATKTLGEDAELGFVREGADRSVSIRLDLAPEVPARDQMVLKRGDGLPGLSIVNVNPAVISELSLPVTSDGVLVTNARGAARRVGLRPGDFIVAVDGTPVADAANLAALLAQTSGDTELKIVRRGKAGPLRYRRR